MDIKRKLQEFNRRWNLKEDLSEEEEFKKFKTRVLNIFRDIDYYVTEEGIALFCNILGIPEEWNYQPYGDYKWSKNIINSLIKEDNPLKFYRLLEIIFCLPIKTHYSYYNEVKYSKEILAQKLAEAIHFSNINLAMKVKENGEIILYPAGEKELDQKLVNEVLSFLNEESQKHFIEALKFYRVRNYVKSAESLRRSLEEFLRFKLKNQKGLKKNIDELLKKLKGDKRDPLIRNIIFQTFSYLDQYFDENSKHKDGDIDEPEIEYLIYQTGVLMRFIVKIIK